MLLQFITEPDPLFSLCVSDAHPGLQEAIRKELIGCSRQRCKIHFMRNILSHVPARDKKYPAGRIKPIWNQPDSHSAREYANRIIDEFEEQFSKSMNCLEEGLEDSVQSFEFSEIDSRKTSSANQLEVPLNWNRLPDGRIRWLLERKLRIILDTIGDQRWNHNSPLCVHRTG